MLTSFDRKGKKRNILDHKSSFTRGGSPILDFLKEWLLIYTWVELWIIVGATVLMASTWYMFSLMLGIQNTLIRATAIWSLIFGLTAGAATTNWLVKRRRDGSA